MQMYRYECSCIVANQLDSFQMRRTHMCVSAPAGCYCGMLGFGCITVDSMMAAQGWGKCTCKAKSCNACHANDELFCKGWRLAICCGSFRGTSLRANYLLL